MSTDLAERIRKRREFKFTDGKWKLTLRRPTDAEMSDVFQKNKTNFDVAREFVCGWDGVIENDLVGGGGTDVIEFTAECWAEVIADRQELWPPIFNAVMDAYVTHRKGMSDAAKK